MLTSFEIDSLTAKRLCELAEAKRITVEELLTTYVLGLRATDTVLNGNEGESLKAFDDWVAGFSSNGPNLSDEAVSRSSIYCDR
jgi:hypothetical protein